MIVENSYTGVAGVVRENPLKIGDVKFADNSILLVFLNMGREV